MLKFKMLLKGSHFYYHSNTFFDTGGDWKYLNQTNMTDMLHIGGKQMKTVKLYLLHSTTLKIHRTLNFSHLHTDIDLPISQFPRASTNFHYLHPYVQMLFLLFSAINE